MFSTKKKLFVAIACVTVIGVGIFAVLSSGKPQAPVINEIIQDESAPIASVVEAAPQVIANPNVVSAAATAQQVEDIPVFDPANGDIDIVVPFIPKVTKPPEAEVDDDMENHEPVEGADDSKPPETKPPRQPVAAPPKQSEPQGGDTNSQGQVWFPGFGWVTPGEGTKVIPGHSDGDINKQVGEM